MTIDETNLAIVKSVLKDCGDIVEALSEACEDLITNEMYEELLKDIDRSINILNGKE